MGEVVGFALLFLLFLAIVVAGALVGGCIYQNKLDRLEQENRLLRTSLHAFLRLDAINVAVYRRLTVCGGS